MSKQRVDSMMGERFGLYLEGNLLKLLQILQPEIEHSAMIGDSVQLTCNLSERGCCHILLGNQAEAFILYEFFKKSLSTKTSFSAKEWAAVMRFLALYSLFNSDMETALHYYDESENTYRLINEKEEEAIMLLEAARWAYCLIGQQEKMTYIRKRLSEFAEFLPPESNVDSPASFTNYIIFYSNLETNSHPLIKQFQQFQHTFETNNTQLITEEIYALLEKTSQYKHPIFQAWAAYFAGHTLEKQEYMNKARHLFSTFNIKITEELPTFIQKTAPKLTFTLFTEFTIQKDGKIVFNSMDWKRKKAEELLICLLIQPNLQIDKEVLLEELYPDDDYKKATNRLYVNINAINKTIKEITQSPILIISTKGNKISLNQILIDEIDIQTYLKLYSVATNLWYTDRKEAAELFDKARKLYAHQIVDHLLYASWLETFRLTLKEKQISLLQRLYSYDDDLNRKERLLQEMLDCDPLNEGTIKEKITFLQNQGRSFEAELFYHLKKKLFRSELGIDFEWDVWK